MKDQSSNLGEQDIRAEGCWSRDWNVQAHQTVFRASGLCMLGGVQRRQWQVYLSWLWPESYLVLVETGASM